MRCLLEDLSPGYPSAETVWSKRENICVGLIMPIFARAVDTWYINYLLLHEKQHTAIYLNQNSVNQIISLLVSAGLTRVSTGGQ